MFQPVQTERQIAFHGVCFTGQRGRIGPDASGDVEGVETGAEVVAVDELDHLKDVISGVLFTIS